jgi:hypothetical protein
MLDKEADILLLLREKKRLCRLTTGKREVLVMIVELETTTTKRRERENDQL